MAMVTESDKTGILNSLELAFLHARRGNISDSESIVRDVRSVMPIENFPLAAIKAIFVEGVIAGYRCDWPTAIDRLSRARSLSKVHGNRELELQVLAWIAFVEFNQNRLAEAATFSVEVLKNRNLLDVHTVCRAALVLASLYQLIDDRHSAENWFQFAKRASEQLGETALTSVIIFDAAVIRVSVERFNRYLDIGASRDLDLELLFVRSAINFDAASKVVILAPFHNLLHGQLLNLRAEYVDALTVLSPLLESDVDLSPMIRAQGVLESLWSRSNMDTENLTCQHLDDEVSCLELLVDDDDQAIACWMFSRMYERLGDDSKSKTFDVKSRSACERYLQWRGQFSGDLKRIAEGL